MITVFYSQNILLKCVCFLTVLIRHPTECILGHCRGQPGWCWEPELGTERARGGEQEEEKSQVSVFTKWISDWILFFDAYPADYELNIIMTISLEIKKYLSIAYDFSWPSFISLKCLSLSVIILLRVSFVTYVHQCRILTFLCTLLYRHHPLYLGSTPVAARQCLKCADSR